MADAAQISATSERLQALTDRRARRGRGHAARRSRPATVLSATAPHQSPTTTAPPPTTTITTTIATGGS
jgi:hypothetical protein